MKLKLHCTALFIFIFGVHLVLAQTADGWKQLKPGLSDIDVTRLLGQPDKVERFATVKNNTSDTSVYWSYGPNTVVVITNHLFDRVEKSRSELLKYIQQNASKTQKNGLTIVSYGKN